MTMPAEPMKPIRRKFEVFTALEVSQAFLKNQPLSNWDGVNAPLLVMDSNPVYVGLSIGNTAIARWTVADEDGFRTLELDDEGLATKWVNAEAQAFHNECVAAFRKAIQELD